MLEPKRYNVTNPLRSRASPIPAPADPLRLPGLPRLGAMATPTPI